MIPAPLPAQEAERIAALASCGVLDTAPERSFDHIVQLASQICSTPIALVSLVDRTRQWFKAQVGLSVRETSRDSSFCAHAILAEEPLVVPDAALDPRFCDNPLVCGEPNIRFYAGVPLVIEPGIALGSLCVIDRVPRQLSEAQLDALKLLAKQVVSELNLRRELNVARQSVAQQSISDETLAANVAPANQPTLSDARLHSGSYRSQIAVGAVVEGRYRIERMIGVGGMGQVAEARDLQSDEPVAIKFMRPETLGEREALQRFVREAQVMKRIQCDHVARLRDVGNLPSGAPYIVMDYLEGEDLATRLVRDELLPVDEALEIARQACLGIRAAHDIGVLHRDLKPGNLFLTRGSDGATRVKVLDFGIAKLWSADLNAAQTSLTNARSTLGSPNYMSPEQMMSPENVDQRTDIWSIGVILYQMLCGQVPFEGEGFAEVCVRVITSPLLPVHEVNPRLGPALSGVVSRCLEKERGFRYADMAALLAALQGVDRS